MVRRSTRVLALGALVLVAMGALAAGLGGSLQDNLTIPGTESQEGIDVLGQRFPEVAGTPGQVLFSAPEGEQITDHRDDVMAVVTELRKVDHVEIATNPFSERNKLALSENGRDALVQVQLDVPLDQLDDATIADLEEATGPSLPP